MATHRDAASRSNRPTRTLRPALEPLEARALLATTAPAPIGFLTTDLTLFAPPISAPVEGTTGLIPVATFEDLAASPSPAPSQYVAAISWGDGTITPGVVTIGAGVQQPGSGVSQLVGQISGAHTYAQPGTYSVAVAIDRGAATNFTITSATATGLAIPNAQVLNVAPISVATGSTTGPITVGAFIDPFPGSDAPKSGTYQAEIAWGDGTFSTGLVKVVSGAGGSTTFDAVVNVEGAHTYFEPGTYGVVVALARPGAFYASTSLATATGPAIADAKILDVAQFHSTARRSTGKVAVAAFVDPIAGPTVPKAGTYAAEIAWGDGTESAGTVSIVAGVTQNNATTAVVNVGGKHTYSRSGTYAVVVALARPGQFYSSTEFAQVS